MVSKEGENLIFICSLPRSGSTLLGTLLSNNSVAYCPPEPWFLLRLAEIMGDSSSEKIYDDHLAGIYTRSFIDNESFIESARAFALHVYNRGLQDNGSQIFIDKTPRYYHILDFIERLFPRSKKIWLRRNPLDVAASYRTTWSIDVDTLTGKIVSPSSFDLVHGLHVLKEYFREKSPLKYEVRYEDIVTSPGETLRGLCSFCGIPFSEEMVHYGSNEDIVSTLRDAKAGDKLILKHDSVHSKSVGKWRNTFSERDLAELVGVIGLDVLTETGYGETVHELSERGIQQQTLNLETYADRLSETLKESHFTTVRKDLDVCQNEAKEILMINHDLEKRINWLEEDVKSLEILSNSVSFRDEQIKQLRSYISSVRENRFVKLFRNIKDCVYFFSSHYGVYKPKIDISNELIAYYGKHRSGWTYGLQHLKKIHRVEGVLMDSFVEMTFLYRPERVPHLRPWVGFIHVPANMPKWYYYETSNESIFKMESWQQSFPYCKGLFTLSRYHRETLEKELTVPVNNLLLPTETPSLRWSFDAFSRNKEKKIVQVGWWLRNLHTIFQLKTQKYKKIFLKCDHINKLDNYFEKEKKHLMKEGLFDAGIYDTVETLPFLPNDEYDKLLSENVVIINLYNTSANNVIVECMVRNTPILVNPLDAVVEYLGKDYPLYFNSLEEAARKADDFDLLLEAHKYLIDHPTTGKLNGKYFLKSLAESEIYKSL